MTKNPDYRYFVQPLGDMTNEGIAALLTARNGRTDDAEVQKIVVGGKPIFGVYLVDHHVLTQLKRSVHANNIRVYSQEGEGEIRLYTLYKRSTISRTNAMKKLKADLIKLERK